MQVPFIKTPAEQLMIKLRFETKTFTTYTARLELGQSHTTLILTRKEKYDPTIVLSKRNS